LNQHVAHVTLRAFFGVLKHSTFATSFHDAQSRAEANAIILRLTMITTPAKNSPH
jgi:hypothetical protein